MAFNQFFGSNNKDREIEELKAKLAIQTAENEEKQEIIQRLRDEKKDLAKLDKVVMASEIEKKQAYDIQELTKQIDVLNEKLVETKQNGTKRTGKKATVISSDALDKPSYVEKEKANQAMIEDLKIKQDESQAKAKELEEQLQKAKEENTKLERMTDRLAFLEDAEKKHKAQLAEMGSSVGETKKDLSGAEQRNFNLVHEHREEISRLNEAHKVDAEKGRQADRLARENQQYKDEINHLNVEVHRVDGEAQQAKMQVAGLTQANQDKDTKIDQLQTNLAESNSQLAKKNKESVFYKSAFGSTSVVTGAALIIAGVFLAPAAGIGIGLMAAGALIIVAAAVALCKDKIKQFIGPMQQTHINQSKAHISSAQMTAGC